MRLCFMPEDRDDVGNIPEERSCQYNIFKWNCYAHSMQNTHKNRTMQAGLSLTSLNDKQV